MNRTPPQRDPHSRLCLALLGLLIFVAFPARADIAEQFVEALRDAGHGDLVADYLDRAESDPTVSPEFKAQIPVQRLRSLYEQAVAVTDPADRALALSALSAEAKRLARTQSAAASLQTDLAERTATALADAARRDALLARRQDAGAAKKEKLSAARKALTQARDQLSEAEEAIIGERSKLKGSAPQSPEGRRQLKLGERLALVRLLRARLLLEIAETHPAKSKARKETLTQASKQLGELYETYAKWGVGLYAQLYEGRSYRLLGNNKLAIAALESLATQPASTTELRRIVTLAQAELAALALGRGDAETALEDPAEWLEGLSSSEASGAEGAELRYRLGVAALKLAESKNGAAAQRLRRQARQWLQDSARTPSEVQAEARARWAEATASLGLDTSQHETFVDAFQAGAEAIQAMLATDVELESASKSKREELLERREKSRNAAYEALQAATRLADDAPSPEQAATARYQVAWLDWEAGDARRAAERAVFVARKDADLPAGEDAARLALAALEKLDRDGVPEASQKLAEFVAFATEKWPNSEVAKSAASVLVATALRAGDLDRAREILRKVPEQQRAELSLRLAVADWERSKTDPAKRAQALQGLRTSFREATTERKASPLATTAALYLAEVDLDAGKFGAAGKRLRDPNSGPLTKLSSGEPPADNVAFALAAQRALVRLKAATGGSIEGQIKQIEQLLSSAPPEQTGGDRAWLGMAAAVYGDLQRLSGDRVASAASACLALLDRLGALEQNSDWNTQLWIAQTRLACADLVDEDQSIGAIEASAVGFARLVQQSEVDPRYAPSPTAALAVRLRLAQSQRRLGEYADAVDTLTAMLAGKGALLEAQQEAADTLQAWGVDTRSAEKLEQAIAGAQPGSDGKNVIWGWSKLAAIAGRYAASDPRRRDLFFEAWRRVAECRFEASKLASGAEQDEQLRKASTTLLALQRQNPGLGGEATRSRFNELYREIQIANGQTPTGLPEIDQ